MNLVHRLVVIGLGVGLIGCDKKPANKPANSGASGNSALTAPIDYLGAQGRAKVHATKVLSTVQIQDAIQKFNAMEERFPASLEELVSQHYLQAMPEAPRGKRFIYNSQTGQLGLVNE